MGWLTWPKWPFLERGKWRFWNECEGLWARGSRVALCCTFEASLLFPGFPCGIIIYHSKGTQFYLPNFGARSGFEDLFPYLFCKLPNEWKIRKIREKERRKIGFREPIRPCQKNDGQIRTFPHMVRTRMGLETNTQKSKREKSSNSKKKSAILQFEFDRILAHENPVFFCLKSMLC